MKTVTPYTSAFSPENRKKINLFEQEEGPEEVAELIKKSRESTIGKTLVRINSRTCVYLSAEKNNPEYIAKLRNKYKI
jgi:hypothetical protein